MPLLPIFVYRPTKETLTNSVDPYQMPQNAVFDQGLPVCIKTIFVRKLITISCKLLTGLYKENGHRAMTLIRKYSTPTPFSSGKGVFLKLGATRKRRKKCSLWLPFPVVCLSSYNRGPSWRRNPSIIILQGSISVILSSKASLFFFLFIFFIF